MEGSNLPESGDRGGRLHSLAMPEMLPGSAEMSARSLVQAFGKVRCSGGQQGTLSAAKRSAWPGRQRDERQLVEELRVALPGIDEGGMQTVEIAAALGFGETPVRKLLRG